MIPRTDEYGNRIKGKGGKQLWKPTYADSHLPPYDDAFVIPIDGKKVPLWRYIEAYETVKDRNGRLVPFELNPAQCKMYAEMAEMKLSGKPVRINDCKSRQMGGSTLIAGMFFALACFDPGKECGVIADTLDHGKGLLSKYRLFWQTSPDFLRKRIKLESDNATEMSFSYGDSAAISSITVLVQGDGAGRSRHFSYVHESEVGVWDEIFATIGALESTVSYTDKDSIVVRETTAKGANEWKTVYDQSVAGRGTYKAMFLPWYLEPSYAMPYDGHPFIEYEQRLKDEHNLSDNQIQFWRSMWENYSRSYEIMGQEYPTTATEAFLSSGSGIFNSRLVAERKTQLMESKPLRKGFFECHHVSSQDEQAISVSNIRWFDSPNGSVTIFEEPIMGHPYILVNDPASGGEDYWATQVIDSSNCRQVATYHQSKCQADEAVYQSYCLYDLYRMKGQNRVLAAGENNTTTYLLSRFAKMGVRDIYVDRNGDISERFANSYGYRTKTTNRNQMIQEFVEAFSDDPSIIQDYETICEMETFQYVRTGRTHTMKAMAVGEDHDDLVMAYAGFFLVRPSWYATIEDKKEKKELPKGFDPLDSNRKRLSVGNKFQIWG